jgi:acetyl esterase/lipase
VPARVENLAGLPPAWIGVGAIDLFVQEDIEYARRLAEAGVPVELYVAPGAFHGFDFFAPASRVTTKFVDSWTRALRRGLGVEAGGGG